MKHIIARMGAALASAALGFAIGGTAQAYVVEGKGIVTETYSMSTNPSLFSQHYVIYRSSSGSRIYRLANWARPFERSSAVGQAVMPPGYLENYGANWRELS